MSLRPDHRRSIAALGDVSDPACWSGTPWHFWQAAKSGGFAEIPWELDLSQITWQRWFWNLGGLMLGRKGGFQYSDWFLNLAEKQVSRELFQTEIITCNQHYPRAASVKAAGGKLSYYVDAPFVALASGRGLDLHLPAAVTRRATALEIANFEASERIITMARWAADVIVQECRVPRSKVHTILPGANLELPADWSFPGFVDGVGKSRDLVLGFIGKDWERKGLPWLLDLRDELDRRGWRVMVQAAGHAPAELAQRKGLEFAGFIDKQKEPQRFLNFLTHCDLGCLFSKHEALGLSTLEFLRAGVPVMGFAHEGMADTLPPDAGFRFASDSSIEEAADALEGYLTDEAAQRRMRGNAQKWSPHMTWERCIREFKELWSTGNIHSPVRPWLGLSAGTPALL